MDRPAVLLQRILLGAVAALTCAWLIASLTASREIADAAQLATSAGALGHKITPTELADARRGLDDARRFNTDASPLYAEFGLLFLSGRNREALQVARRLLKEEPKNFDAWRLLYGFSSRTNPVRARYARHRALQLNPLATWAFPRVPEGARSRSG